MTDRSEDPGTLGGRLLRARLSFSASVGRAVTQVEVGRMVGVTGVTVSRWEANKKEPSLAKIGMVAAALHADPGWLAFGNIARPTSRRVPVIVQQLASAVHIAHGALVNGDTQTAFTYLAAALKNADDILHSSPDSQ